MRDFLFAGDTAVVAHTEWALQRITTCFRDAAQLFGLEVSLKKTEVLHQPAPQEECHPPTSPSAKESWNQFSNSLTWALPSHPMPWSTRKLTSDWQRRTAPSVDSTSVCGTIRAWNERPRSVFTELLCSLLWSTAPRPGSHTATASNSYSVSIGVAFAPSSHPLERLCHQCRGPRTGWSSQHWSHAIEMPAPVGWACDPDGGTTPSQDHRVWRTVSWPSRQRDTKEKIQELPQEVTQVQQHRPPSADNYRCRAGRLAPHTPHSCQKLWNHTLWSPQRKTSAEKNQGCWCPRDPKPWSDLQMPSLPPYLPVPDWPRQP